MGEKLTKKVIIEYNSYPMRLGKIHLIDPRFPESRELDSVRYGRESRSNEEREKAKKIISEADNHGIYTLNGRNLQISSLSYFRLGHSATIDFKTFEALGRPIRIEANKSIIYRKARKRSIAECQRETDVISSKFD